MKGLVKNLKVPVRVLAGIYNFYYFSCLFFKSRIRRSHFFLGSLLEGKFNWMGARERRVAKKTRHNDINLMKLRILHLDDVLGRLEAYGYRLVPEDDVSCS